MPLDRIEGNINYHLDLVVIHGSGMEINSHGETIPTFDSMLRIIAGVKAYELGWTKHLLFSGGSTLGRYHRSEAETCVEFLYNPHPFWGKIPPKIRISEDTITIENSSKSTGDNIASLVKNYESAEQLRIGFCTNDYHMPYVTALARNFNLHPIAISAETFALARNPELHEVIKQRYASPEMKKIEMTQRLLRFELLIDPKARIPALIANLTRK